MTKDEWIHMMREVPGNAEIDAFDPDLGDYAPITGMVAEWGNRDGEHVMVVRMHTDDMNS
ncbi:hypothetical protein WK13_34570 [Burkholderia ubonensis]|uniref:hypothetical protein n=1 Tax=Burkholderia ubonensis TaxID=101571 RepID=UPI00075B2C4B|nr:hypothetical protein [Burkholderia ubonensis]KVR21664.1 hypothetical protein WK13_34570 [Burkholderia ubonensis]